MTRAALISLAKSNIPPDVQELLVRGDPMRGIAPGALAKAIAAELLEEVAQLQRTANELEEHIAKMKKLSRRGNWIVAVAALAGLVNAAALIARGYLP